MTEIQPLMHEYISKFISDIRRCAVNDIQAGVALRAPTENSGKALIKRIGGVPFRTERIGDVQYARSLYTAIRWLYETHEEDEA